MLYFYDDPPVWIPTQSESSLNTINHLCAPSRGKRVRLNNPVSGIPRSARFTKIQSKATHAHLTA